MQTTNNILLIETNCETFAGGHSFVATGMVFSSIVPMLVETNTSTIETSWNTIEGNLGEIETNMGAIEANIILASTAPYILYYKSIN